MNRKEYEKMYREKYRDEITEKNEKYYIKNIDKIKLKNRLYYLENRDELNRKVREKRHQIKEQKLMSKNDICVM